MGSRFRRLIVGNADLVLCLLLGVTGLWLVKGIGHEKADEAIVIATLAGALFGGAAILCGNWINRANDRRRSAAEEEERHARLKMLITAELVNVAAGYLGTKKLMDAALESVYQTGGSLPDASLLMQHLPRAMPLTLNLGVELLALEKPAIDAVVTLQSNLTITRLRMEEVVGGEVHIGLLRLQGIAASLCHDMEILAQCFDHIAPTRKMAMMDEPPELASDLLRLVARGEKTRSRLDEDSIKEVVMTAPRQRDAKKSNRAPLSSPAALVSGLILLAFLTGETWSFVTSQQTPDAPLARWPLYIIFGWGGMFSVGLIVWSFRDWFRIHWVGNPTLAVIGGVSGAIITAVTLAMTLQAGASQDQSARQQLAILRDQLRVMQQIEQKLDLSSGQSVARKPDESSPDGPAQNTPSLPLSKPPRSATRAPDALQPESTHLKARPPRP